MNRINRVVTAAALVAAVGASVSLAFQPETTRPTQPSTQPSTMPGTQPGRDTNRQPGMSQPGRDNTNFNQPGQTNILQKGQKLSRDQVMNLTNSWPDDSKKAARATLEKYGPPDGGSFNELIWHDAGPWKKVVVSAEPHDHNFPIAHKDVLMGVINMKVPQDKVADLVAFDGSLVVNRTAGTIAAVCDREESNFAALNLANDIITGSKSVQEARDQLARVAMGLQQGTNDPITQDFKFDVDNNRDQGDPDQPQRGNTPGMDRPSTPSTPTTPRTPGLEPTTPRTPGTDPNIPRSPGTDPNRPTPPRDPMNPSPTSPTTPRPGGG